MTQLIYISSYLQMIYIYFMIMPGHFLPAVSRRTPGTPRVPEEELTTFYNINTSTGTQQYVCKSSQMICVRRIIYLYDRSKYKYLLDIMMIYMIYIQKNNTKIKENKTYHVKPKKASTKQIIMVINIIINCSCLQR